MGGKPLAGVGDGHVTSRRAVRQGSYGDRTLADVPTGELAHIELDWPRCAGEGVVA
jgi:hypothetical protein